LLKQKWSLGPKYGLERRVWQFYTICDKNQGLNVKIDKVTAILVLGSAAGQLQVTLGSAQKFVWGCMVGFQKFGCSSGAPRRPTAERWNFAELGATDLKRAFGKWKPTETGVVYCPFEQNCISWYKMQISYF
jgi:hypothetical protein